MIVVDTNIIAYLLIPGNQTRQARMALTKDSSWAVPPLGHSEFRNVLAAYLRRNLMSLDTALSVMEVAEDFLRASEYHVSSREVIKLVARSRCSAYDCEFVALAEELGVPLITTDTQILAEFPSVAIALESFAPAPDNLGR